MSVELDGWIDPHLLRICCMPSQMACRRSMSSITLYSVSAFRPLYCLSGCTAT